jgi:glycosyltransferase involved in cell wall biosynthesis
MHVTLGGHACVMLRILFVAPGALTGAHLPFVRREMEALRAAGHTVEALSFDNSSYLPWHFATQFSEIKGLIRNFKPDLVHAQFGKFNALVAALAKGGVPLVVTFRGTDINHNTKYSSLRSAVGIAASQLAAFLSSGLVCVSREIAAKVWARKPCIVVPTGVDLQTFVPMEREEARKKLGFGSEERIVLFNAGRNPAVKDPQLALASVEVARLLLGEIRLVVLDGTADPQDVPLYMNAADCLLVTSRTEGSPTVVQEAMACNLPVVSVDVGDVRERLEGVTPSFVTTRDAASVGAAMVEILSKRERSNGREHAAALGVDAIAARLSEFYGALLRGTPISVRSTTLPESRARQTTVGAGRRLS